MELSAPGPSGLLTSLPKPTTLLQPRTSVDDNPATVIAAENRWLLRAPAQITIWLLLLIVSLGPQHSLFVCTTGQCRAHAVLAAPAEQGCSCCNEGAKTTTDDRSGGTSRNGAHRSHHCCIDVALLTELGPLPTPVDCPDVQPPCIGTVPYLAADERVDRGSTLLPRNTGPPRTDQRTDLIALTILRR